MKLNLVSRHPNKMLLCSCQNIVLPDKMGKISRCSACYPIGLHTYPLWTGGLQQDANNIIEHILWAAARWCGI